MDSNRKSFALVAALVLGAAPLFSKEDEWHLNDHVLFLADFLYMERTLLHNHTIVNRLPENDCSCLGVMGTKKLMHEFNWEPGYRVGLGIQRDEKATVEGNYLALSDFVGKRRQHGPDNLSYPFHDDDFTNDFYQADQADAKYKSRMRSAEANYWRHMTPRYVDYFSGSWMIGFRYMYLKEACILQFTKDDNRSNYNTFTRNHLYGGQVGGFLEWNPMRHLTWNFTAKFGGMFNHTSQRTFLADNNNTTTIRDFKKFKNRATFLADLAFSMNYRLFRAFSIHVGYEMIYLTGVALAPEQLSNSASIRAHEYVNAHGNALWHGLFAGALLSF